LEGVDEQSKEFMRILLTTRAEMFTDRFDPANQLNRSNDLFTVPLLLVVNLLHQSFQNAQSAKLFPGRFASLRVFAG
jgi:hypothetical protein